MSVCGQESRLFRTHFHPFEKNQQQLHRLNRKCQYEVTRFLLGDNEHNKPQLADPRVMAIIPITTAVEPFKILSQHLSLGVFSIKSTGGRFQGPRFDFTIRRECGGLHLQPPSFRPSDAWNSRFCTGPCRCLPFAANTGSHPQPATPHEPHLNALPHIATPCPARLILLFGPAPRWCCSGRRAARPCITCKPTIAIAAGAYFACITTIACPSGYCTTVSHACSSNNRSRLRHPLMEWVHWVRIASLISACSRVCRAGD